VLVDVRAIAAPVPLANGTVNKIRMLYSGLPK
jgi:hypothetical protein